MDLQTERVPAVREGFPAFWRFYLKQHSHPRNRFFHVLGTSLAVLFIAAAIRVNPWFWLAAIVSGYGFAWYGHFVFERNKPATFKAPLRSFLCDYVMVFHTLWKSVRPARTGDRRSG